MNNAVEPVDTTNYELFCLIVNFGTGSRVLKIARNNGISGGTISLAKGTVASRLLEILDISDTRKEVVMMISEQKRAYDALEALNRELALQKPNHGVAFSVSVAGLVGMRKINYNKHREGSGNTMNSAIFVIVDRGNAEEVVDAAKTAGARGATVINARGSGIHETQMLFNMEIEPEKEIVLILAQKDIVAPVVSSIREKTKLDEPGNGVLFVLDVNQIYGVR